MITYTLLAIPFLCVSVVVAYVSRWRPGRRWAAGLCVLLLLTAVFDSLIIQYDIVGYEVSKILGFYIGRAPVEDFAYAVAAALIVPALWHTLDSRKKDRR